MSGEWMTSEQRYFWQIALELKLRRLSGVAFQDFFADVMTRAYGDDYVPTRPYGSLGDKGCDGYLASSGKVFACYGKVDDAALSVSTLVLKMEEDHGKASGHLKGAMKEWCFVHNLLDGTPTDVTVIKMTEMREAHPNHKFGIMGRKGFENVVFTLPEADIVALLGPAASAEDTRNLRLEIVADLINSIISAVEAAPFDNDEPKPVPADKLEFNKLPRHWCFTIRSQMANAHLVSLYLGEHPDPEREVKVAAAFRSKYIALKEQNLSPDDIMSGLYESVVGIGTVTNERAVAAQAVLAFLFASCDIFEDTPFESAA